MNSTKVYCKVVNYKVRGFLCLYSHSYGCKLNIRNIIIALKNTKHKSKNKTLLFGKDKTSLLLGSSTGYGLITCLTLIFYFDIDTSLNIFFDKKPCDLKTGTAGWYNMFFTSYYTAKYLNIYNYDKKHFFLNSNIFDANSKKKICKFLLSIKRKVDLLIYSIASPRRYEYTATIKPTRDNIKLKNIDTDCNKIKYIVLNAALSFETDNTIKVMGGEDWALWIIYLKKCNLISMNFTTYTHSYIGSEITWPIYKYGTLGLAKFNLYAYSKKILNFCKLFGGRVFLFINKALITQASAAIPAVPLYISLLYNKTRKSWTHENYINQNLRLFYRLNMFERIKFSVVRLDDFEIKTSTQFEIIFKWNLVNSNNLLIISNFLEYKKSFLNLFGFYIKSVDYSLPVKLEFNSKNLIIL